MSDVLDPGNPAARTCRWCNSSKYVKNGALICRACDGPIHLLKIKSDSS